MNRLKVIDMGEKVQGVHLRGNKRNPEPEYFRVCFPGGDIDIVRCDDDTYWVHVRVNREGGSGFIPGETIEGKIIDGRVDVLGKAASQTSCGDLDREDAFHVAIRVGVRQP